MLMKLCLRRLEGTRVVVELTLFEKLVKVLVMGIQGWLEVLVRMIWKRRKGMVEGFGSFMTIIRNLEIQISFKKDFFKKK